MTIIIVLMALVLLRFLFLLRITYCYSYHSVRVLRLEIVKIAYLRKPVEHLLDNVTITTIQ